MEALLHSLYHEYQILTKEQESLSSRLFHLSYLIRIYEGLLPTATPSTFSQIQQEQENGPLPIEDPVVSPSPIDPYPTTGEWKEKVFYTLKKLNKAATVREVAQFVVEAEGSSDPKSIKNIIGFYLSGLSKKGEIIVDKTLHQHKYSLKS